jgi:hypothetical protein
MLVELHGIISSTAIFSSVPCSPCQNPSHHGFSGPEHCWPSLDVIRACKHFMYTTEIETPSYLSVSAKLLVCIIISESVIRGYSLYVCNTLLKFSMCILVLSFWVQTVVRYSGGSAALCVLNWQTYHSCWCRNNFEIVFSILTSSFMDWENCLHVFIF